MKTESLPPEVILAARAWRSAYTRFIPGVDLDAADEAFKEILYSSGVITPEMNVDEIEVTSSGVDVTTGIIVITIRLEAA